MPVRLALAALFSLLLAGCGGDDRERLVVYSPHGPEVLDPYEAAYEAANPGVDVQMLTLGSQDVYDRVRTEAANPQASLWWGAPAFIFERAAAEGLLEPYRPTWADAVDPIARGENDTWYGAYRIPQVLMVAESLQPADRPADWDDLLDPRFSDRIIVRSPLASGSMRTIFSALILRQPTVEEGYRWLARLDAQTKRYAANPSQLYLQIARGEGDLTVWNLTDVVIQSTINEQPFDYVLPASGVPVLVDGIALVQGGPNPDRARDFYEFVTTREALVDHARRYHYIPARTDVPADSLPGWMATALANPMPLDWARIQAHEAEWMQHWEERIKGRGADYLAETAP